MANIIGIGTDLVLIERMGPLFARYGDRFLNRILTPIERTYLIQFQQESKRMAFLAKRFAAKEALAKALGTGIAQGVSFQDFIIERGLANRPVVTLAGKAKIIAYHLGVVDIHLSITDERAHALAFAVLSS